MSYTTTSYVEGGDLSPSICGFAAVLVHSARFLLCSPPADARRNGLEPSCRHARRHN